MRRKILITGLTCVFLFVSGICYSCSYGQKEQSAYDTADTEKNTDFGALEKLDKAASEKLILSDEESEEDKSEEPDQTTMNLSPTALPEEAKEKGIIYVHVCGSVKHPGVYATDVDSRVVDALELAGGLTKDAAGDYLNQAQRITDGQRVYVPAKSELDSLTIDDYVIGGEAASLEESKDASLININSADANQLMTLPGIGQSKANSIIEYRNVNGTFKTIEDLMNVPGIKEGSFHQISDKITVK